MASVLRQRIPWTRPGIVGENIPLLESGSASVVEGAEGIELAELGAGSAFAGVEEAGAALDATGVGLKIFLRFQCVDQVLVLLSHISVILWRVSLLGLILPNVHIFHMHQIL